MSTFVKASTDGNHDGQLVPIRAIDGRPHRWSVRLSKAASVTTIGVEVRAPGVRKTPSPLGPATRICFSPEMDLPLTETSCPCLSTIGTRTAGKPNQEGW